ncbi:MAG: acylphosphatase [Gammaproteobacteria bacterium]|nr:acylphosphatase [Gammaproteobacteria bacterium]
MMSSNQNGACLHCYVSGRVQGVFFRSSTREQAKQLGLTGYARNLPDGRVEVYACGQLEALEELKVWLSRGPAHAKVSAVECEALAYESLQGFRVSY